MNMQSEKTIHYRFEIEGHAPYECDVEVQRHGGVPMQIEGAPDWTKLEFQQCEGCELKNSDYCPVALRLVEPVEQLGRFYSYDRVKVTAQTNERSISTDTDLQTAITSLFGLLMASSQCPSMTPLRPMAWHHLPFSSFEETLYRMVSSHLLGHYFAGDIAATQLDIREEVLGIYRMLNRINLGIVERLREAAVSQKDAPFNAITHLDNYATLITMALESELEEIKGLYSQKAIADER